MGKEADTFEKALCIMNKLFNRDCQFVLATAQDNVPSARVVDTLFSEGTFYIVTYAKSKKAREIEKNPNVSLCKELYSFSGTAYNIGHPLDLLNKDIRKKLVKAFELWYFKHNNENDENMCYIKIKPAQGFFYMDGTGYRVDFSTKEADEFPFEFINVVL